MKRDTLKYFIVISQFLLGTGYSFGQFSIKTNPVLLFIDEPSLCLEKGINSYLSIGVSGYPTLRSGQGDGFTIDAYYFIGTELRYYQSGKRNKGYYNGISVGYSFELESGQSIPEKGISIGVPVGYQFLIMEKGIIDLGLLVQYSFARKPDQAPIVLNPYLSIGYSF